MNIPTEILSVSKLLTCCMNPFEEGVWPYQDQEFQYPGQPLRMEMVKKYIKQGTLEHPEKWLKENNCQFEIHEARVAWLVVNGWDEPIEIDFCGQYPLIDGHHRLAAAIFRKDTAIEADCSGFVDHIKKFRSKSKKYFTVTKVIK